MCTMSLHRNYTQLPSPNTPHSRVRCGLVQFDYRLLIMLVGNITNTVEFIDMADIQAGWFIIPGIDLGPLTGKMSLVSLQVNQVKPEGEVFFLEHFNELVYLMDKRGNWRTMQPTGDVNYVSSAMVDAAYFKDTDGTCSIS